MDRARPFPASNCLRAVAPIRTEEQIARKAEELGVSEVAIHN